MSLGCARCGDCCNPVYLTTHAREQIEGQAARPDEHVHPENLADLRFVADHWHEVGRTANGSRYRCDAYDVDTRSCTAHDDRPSICSGFPWYGSDGADRDDRARGIHPRCSYLLDVAPAARHPDARPLIPLTVLEAS